jgi:quinol monooxygenase YgiN
VAFVVTAKWTARDGEEGAVANAIRQLLGPTRAEPGNLVYQCHRDPDDPRVFFLYEMYVDRDAYLAHGASPHFHAYAVTEGIPRLDSRERAFYVTWDGE